MYVYLTIAYNFNHGLVNEQQGSSLKYFMHNFRIITKAYANKKQYSYGNHNLVSKCFDSNWFEISIAFFSLLLLISLLFYVQKKSFFCFIELFKTIHILMWITSFIALLILVVIYKMFETNAKTYLWSYFLSQNSCIFDRQKILIISFTLA